MLLRLFLLRCSLTSFNLYDRLWAEKLEFGSKWWWTIFKIYFNLISNMHKHTSLLCSINHVRVRQCAKQADDMTAGGVKKRLSIKTNNATYCLSFGNQVSFVLVPLEQWSTLTQTTYIYIEYSHFTSLSWQPHNLHMLNPRLKLAANQDQVQAICTSRLAN